MLLQLLHHLVHVEHQHHFLIGPLHLLATFCSSTSSSLHCPLSVTSLALRSRRRCSGLAASLNSLCRRSAEALSVSEAAGGVARSGAPAISWHPSLSLSRTQAVAVVCEWTESRACAPPCQLPSRELGTVALPPDSSRPVATESQLMHLHLMHLSGLEIKKMAKFHTSFAQ